MKEENPYKNAPRLLLPLGTRMDEFEDFLLMEKKILHIRDYVDNPGEHGTDMMYLFEIQGEDILVQCIFYQDYSREENEKEMREITYLVSDKIITKGIKGGDDKSFNNYEDGKLNKDQKEWRKVLEHFSTPHLIEDDNKERTPEAVAKIKAFMFYQILGKTKAKKLIQNEIDKLGSKAKKQDIAELNEIMSTGTIKRPKHYEQLYCMEGLREMAKEDKTPKGKKRLEELDNFVKRLKEDK